MIFVMVGCLTALGRLFGCCPGATGKLSMTMRNHNNDKPGIRDIILGDPLEVASRFVVAQDWFVKQSSAHSFIADVPGRWGHYQLVADWETDAEIFSAEARLDVLVEGIDTTDLLRLIAELNKGLYFGHFQLSEDNRQIILRHRLLLRGAGGATAEQIEDMIDILLGQCEQAAPLLCQMVYGNPEQTAAAAQLVMTPALGEA